MWTVNIFLLQVLFFHIAGAAKIPADHMNTKNKIIVAVSERKPFVVFNPNGPPTGLDVLIIENFAKKMRLNVEYVRVNESLDALLAEKGRNKFSLRATLRYD